MVFGKLARKSPINLFHDCNAIITQDMPNEATGPGWQSEDTLTDFSSSFVLWQCTERLQWNTSQEVVAQCTWSFHKSATTLGRLTLLAPRIV
jgi:hypothetical protein